MSEVVLLGHLVRPSAWAPVLPRLEAAHRVTFLDVPGFGDAPLPTGPWDLPALGRHLAETLATRGLSAAHLVGISMAGSVALETARTGAVASVTAFSPPGFWSPAETARIMATIGSLYASTLVARPLVALAGRSDFLRRRVWAGITAHPDLFDRAVADELVLDAARNMRHLASPRSALTGLRAVAGYRLEPLEGSVPVTIAWGDRDRFTPYRSDATRARQVLPLARHVTLHGCGHLPMYDDPEQVADVILSTVADA